MMSHRRNSLAAQRFAERRLREDDAPRLTSQVPSLARLELAIEERSGCAATKHIRRFVIENTPALFLVPCGDPRCTDGEHDLTTYVMRALRARETTFKGADDCVGSVGTGICHRVLHYEGTAEYRT